MNAKKILLILAAVVLGGGAAFYWVVLRHRPAENPFISATPAASTGTPGDNSPPLPVKPAAKAPDWAALAPEGTFFLLGTSDLPALTAELRAGPAGKTAAAASVKAFLEALAAEPAGEAGEIYGALKLGLQVADFSDGPAFLAVWRSPESGARETAAAFRVRPADAERVLHFVEDALKSPVAKARMEPVDSGQVCKTAAPSGSEGRAWGRCGGWVVASRSVAGCKRLLGGIAKSATAAPRVELGQALAAAGAGRIVGCLDARKLGNKVPSALGWEPSGWLSYSASPDAAGRWSEWLLLDGQPAAGGGLLGALAAGGERPVLAGLPESALACFTANVADGPRFWSGFCRALAPADPDQVMERAASALRGEFTVGCTLQRQALYPQTLLGAGLAPGAAAKLGPGADEALALFGNGGRVEGADYAGVRLRWLEGHSPVDPSGPAPCYAFQGDRLLAASSTAPLKEHLAGRGAKWLNAEEARRLGSGLLGARVDLRAAMPFIAKLAGDLGLQDGLPVSAAGRLPRSEELGEYLGAVELVAGRAGRRLWAELRGPLPLGAVVAAGVALGDF